MFAFRRFVASVAIATFVFHPSAKIAAQQQLLFGPALQAASSEASSAATAPAATAAPAVTPAGVAPAADKRAQNSEQLRLAQRKLDANGATDKAAAQEVAYLQTRDAVLAQQEAVAQQIKDATARKAKFEAQLNAPPSTKQCTFAELDQMKNDLADDQARAALLADKLETANANRDRAQAAYDDYQSKSRQAQAAYENGKASAKSAELGAAAERAKRDAELAGDVLALRTSEVTREQLAKDIQKINQKLHQDQVARLIPIVKFTKDVYDAQIADIKKKQDEATNAMTQATANLRNTELELAEIKKKVDAATDLNRAELTEQSGALWRTKQRYTEEFDSWSQRLQQLNQLKLAWERRYELATTQPDPNDQDVYLKLKSEQKETQREIDELSSAVRIQILTMKDLRTQLTKVSQKAATAVSSNQSTLLPWIKVQQAQLEETLRVYDQKLVSVDSARRVHEKLLDELNASLKAMTPKTLALSAWYQFKQVWDYPFHIGGNTITVGMTVQALTTLVLGWIFARFASIVVAYRLLKRFHLSKDASSAIRSLIYYSMLFIVVLESMRMVNVDLTALTILGGALAIGVGFGSQALINNFIGGLIMLAERPVRLGERITFGGTDGVVEDVGFRCTKLRTSSDHLLTIPNSTLVNESIENIDRRRTIRRKVNIAVTYNMSREQLATAVQTIRDILEEREIRERIHPIIGFEEFLPRVFFSEFAAESLVIQMVYWYGPVDWWAYMEHAERVNFRIMEEFERLGIEFAFPSKTSFVKNAKKPTGREPGSYAA